LLRVKPLLEHRARKDAPPSLLYITIKITPTPLPPPPIPLLSWAGRRQGFSPQPSASVEITYENKIKLTSRTLNVFINYFASIVQPNNFPMCVRSKLGALKISPNHRP
jgi:hypothetical protein